MTPAQIKRELSELERQRAQLDVEAKAIRDLDERRAMLERALPSPAAIHQAEVDLADCRTVFATTAATFDASAVEYFTALDVAEVVGRRLAAARRAATVIVNTMLTTAATAGLKVDLPTVPTLRPALARVGYLQALLCADVAAHGEIDDTVTRDLAAARG